MQNNETMTLNEKINGIMEEVYKKMSISDLRCFGRKDCK